MKFALLIMGWFDIAYGAYLYKADWGWESIIGLGLLLLGGLLLERWAVLADRELRR